MLGKWENIVSSGSCEVCYDLLLTGLSLKTPALKNSCVLLKVLLHYQLWEGLNSG